MRLDPVSLKLFVSIVETGTISAAAEREHVAASAVSRRISDLETALKTTLLRRTNKGVEPTAAGLALLNLARGVLHSLDEIAAQMAEYSTGVRGQVRVAANLSAITQFLPSEIKQFLGLHPQVQIHLEELISTMVTKAVAENQADIGIFAHVPFGQEVETYRYRKDHLVLITPRDHPLAARGQVNFAEALDYEFVGLHVGSAINLQLVKAATDLDRTVRMRIQVTSYEALCLMVETGLGIGVLPEAVARRYLGTLEIAQLRLDEPWAERELKLCVRSRAALPVAARLLLDHLRHDD
ncbi:MAG: LysR family transcriptional regulator [Betaproteobacteria bacterium HGW-Betaproteobacteria-13]|jgi:DNA-binding transcriptional LysR family regulator|nr:MAG: LysR family transcriptional regulator [Betaproteobacteria bacterium HGW-Betaproteobacteria-13]